jgi:hypothetical protein
VMLILYWRKMIKKCQCRIPKDICPILFDEL